MLVIDKYAYQNKIVHWSPVLKGWLWLLGMVLAFQPIIWLKVLLLVGVIGATLYVTGVGLHQYLRWYYGILPFLLLSILGIILTVGPTQRTLYWSIPVFGQYFGISKTMLPQGLTIGLRALSAITCTYFLALTTPFQQIVYLLVKLHLPRLLIEATMLMYRFIFIFIAAWEQIYHAQQLRFGYRNFHTSIHSLSLLIKLLFEQIIYNYREMDNALAVKLYHGEFPIMTKERSGNNA